MVSGDILEEDKRLVYGGASYPFSSSSSLFSSSSRLRGVEGGSDDVDTGTRSSSSSSRRSSGGYIGALNAKIMTAGLGIVLIGLSALAVLQNDASNMEMKLGLFDTQNLVSEQLTAANVKVTAPSSSEVRMGKGGVVSSAAAELAIAAAEDRVISKDMTVDEKIIASKEANDPDRRHSDAAWLKSHPSFVPLTAKQVKEFYSSSSSSSSREGKESSKVSLSTGTDKDKKHEVSLPKKSLVEDPVVSKLGNRLSATIDDNEGYKKRTSKAEKVKLARENKLNKHSGENVVFPQRQEADVVHREIIAHAAHTAAAAAVSNSASNNTKTNTKTNAGMVDVDDEKKNAMKVTAEKLTTNKEKEQKKRDAAEHRKAEKKLQLKFEKTPVVYPKWDYEHSKPQKGYYFPQFEHVPTKEEVLDHRTKTKATTNLRIAEDLPVPVNGSAFVYLPHRSLHLKNKSLTGKDIGVWDMSRDSKIADYADGQFVVASLRGIGPLYYSMDSGESFYDFRKSSGEKDWVAVAVNYEGEKITAVAKGPVSFDSETGAKDDGSDTAGIFTSSDFGVTWVESSDETGPYTHLAASFDGEKVYVAVNGENPSILRSQDQGKSWVVVDEFPVAPGKWTSIATDYSGDNVYVASESAEEGGFIFASENKGKTFSVRSELGMKKWSGIYPQNWGDRVFLTAYDDSSIYYTKDVGATFEVAATMPFINSSLCVSTEQYGGGFIYAVKPGEYIMKSFDKGSTFHADTVSGKRNWDKCLMTSRGSFDVVSTRDDGLYTDKAPTTPLTDEQVGYPYRFGGPLQTSDNDLLSEVAMSANGTFVAIAFGNSRTEGSGVFISGDRGDTWQNLVIEPELNRFEEWGIDISDDGQKIVVIGWNEDPVVARNAFISHDGGSSWKASPETLNAQYVDASDDLKHIFVTIEPINEELQKGQIAVSSDYGHSFDIIQLNYTNFYMFTSINSNIDGQYVYATTFDTHGNGFVYRSQDFGQHWTEVPKADSSSEISLEEGYPVDYLPTADWNMIVTSNDGQFVIAQKYMSNLLYRSHDYGVTWLKSAAAPDVYGSICMDGSGMKILGTSQYMYMSLDGGNTWGYDDISGANGWLQCRLSSDGTKAAVRRFLSMENPLDDDISSATSVYLNEPWPPTFPPTTNPTPYPAAEPTRAPSLEPTINPTPDPTFEPSRSPLFNPTLEPTSRPIAPTPEPTKTPSHEPTMEPTSRPWASPTLEPSRGPTLEPVAHPSALPTKEPLAIPSMHPVSPPTDQPVDIPTMEPSPEPSMTPTKEPTLRPTTSPTAVPSTPPSAKPTHTGDPSAMPTHHPNSAPTLEPTKHPQAAPTAEPTRHPVTAPTAEPFAPGEPTMEPTRHPLNTPTLEPTRHPHVQPTFEPSSTAAPTTATPSSEPVAHPTDMPTEAPSDGPTSSPTKPQPTAEPTSGQPTLEPSHGPTHHPASRPTMEPTKHPHTEPTHEPIVPNTPTPEPTRHPAATPTLEPTRHPAVQPTAEPQSETVTTSNAPVGSPTMEPGSEQPVSEPVPEPVATDEPATEPVAEPVEGPTVAPSESPSAAENAGAEPVPAGVPTASPTRDTPLDDGEQDDYVTDNAPEPLPVKCANDYGNTTYCPGLLPASVARVHLRPGCVLLSVNDLTQVTEVHKYQESAILVVCSSSAAGVVKIDGSKLESFDLVFQGQSLISSIIFGDDTQLNGFSDANFTGMNVDLKPPETGTVLGLDTTYFKGTSPRVSTNDRLKSMEFMSGSETLNSCEDAMEVFYFKDLKFNTKHKKHKKMMLMDKKDHRRSLRGV